MHPNEEKQNQPQGEQPQNQDGEKQGEKELPVAIQCKIFSSEQSENVQDNMNKFLMALRNRMMKVISTNYFSQGTKLVGVITYFHPIEEAPSDKKDEQPEQQKELTVKNL